VYPGPEVHFPPLFPWLIAAMSFVTGDYEGAGRIVSLVAGALLPLPVFGIASRLFSPCVGLIAAGLVLLHPLSIYLSFMIYSEGPYATLLLFSVYLAIRLLEQPSLRWWIAVGASFGMCYLLRAEALGVFAIAVTFAAITTKMPGMFRVSCAVFAAA